MAWPPALLVLALGRPASAEVQVVYPSPQPVEHPPAPPPILASSVLPDAIHVAPVFSEVAPQVTTTKTVFGFHDFDNFAIEDSYPDADGTVRSPLLNARAATASSAQSPALQLEHLFQLEEQLAELKERQHFIEVAGGATGPPPSIQPSRVEEEESQTDADQQVDENEDILEEELTTRRSPVTVKSRLRSAHRQSAAVSYKERLKQRFAKEKAKLALRDLTKETAGQRRDFSQETPTHPPAPASGYRARVPRARSFRTRHEEVEREEEPEEEEEPQKTGRSTAGFGSRSRARPSRRQSSRPSFTRSRTSQSKNKIRESIREQTSGRVASKFTPSKKSSFGSRERFSSRDSSNSSPPDEQAKEWRDERPSTTKKPWKKPEDPSKPKIEFKKFNRFDRPNLRKTLFRSKLFSNRPGLKALGGNKKDEEVPDHESSPSALVIETIDDEEILQHLDSPELRFSRLQTTLHVSTLRPEEMPPGEFLEIATIRSPYTFNVEDDQKSTRFITVTRTNTKSMEISASSTFTLSSQASSISPTPSSTLKHTPLFDTASIPAPENILAQNPDDHLRDLAIQGSSDIEVLPPLILASSLHHATPPLETVTESFTTDEVVIKKSVLPVVMGTDTSFLTLSQTYSITKIVTAIKTVPPMELYEFSPEHSFADFDNLFEEAGSENRESLLPGELEFSDQDNFGLGPTPIRVAPPQGFLDVGGLDGEKQKLIHHQKQHNPEIFDLHRPTPTIDSSFFQPESPSAQAPTQASGLDLGALSGLGVTPEQLLYLQLLQNPLAALGLGKQVVTESSPVYKTEPVVESSVLQLFLGAKEFFTTLTSTVGFTTKTDYVLSTRSVSGGGLGGLGGLQPHAPQGLFGGFGGQRVKVISSPVTRNTVFTEYNTEELKVIFRNRPTYTTLTSTTLVTSQVVSFVTQTVTANPLSGLLG